MATMDISISFDEVITIVREYVNERYHLNSGPIAQHHIDVSRDLHAKMYHVRVTETKR